MLRSPRIRCPATREDLRRVEINHVDFDGEVARGVLVVNQDIADSVVRVFTRLFEEGFPIRRMRPVEEYDGDNNASTADESPHANGRAIDINPWENPWRDLRCACWSPSGEFSAREEGRGKILEGGFVWRTFFDEGWIWENIDVPDYMHFDTGYPSGPFTPEVARQNQEAVEAGQAAAEAAAPPQTPRDPRVRGDRPAP
ncbi:M15 family metallopeptidase [Streptomyces hainanensis]|uniref:M15 family peptidase n=1 Tax=Streptomyces hainanensis TaxID=402648 RepID=A0A4R4SER0_9ACTN|nr:M15 family metallopeptidase [Streptomyces hainanensis]TDC61837.1 M15 family peptidase [Streptomyces hainanensis]